MKNEGDAMSGTVGKIGDKKKLDCLIGFKCYENGKELKGITEVVLPDVYPHPCGKKLIKPMKITVNWATLCETATGFVDGRERRLEFHGTIQRFDLQSESIRNHCINVTVHCKLKKLSLGKLDISGNMVTSGVFVADYLRVEIDGVEQLELGKSPEK